MIDRDGSAEHDSSDPSTVEQAPAGGLLARILNEAATYLHLDLDDDPDAALANIVAWIAATLSVSHAGVEASLQDLRDTVDSNVNSFSPEEYQAVERMLTRSWRPRATGEGQTHTVQISEAILVPRAPATDDERGPDFSVAIPISAAGVPRIVGTFTTYDGMVPVQCTYFDNTFVPAVRRGRSPHIDETEGYGFELLRRTVYEFDEHPIRSRRIVRTLRADYAGKSLGRYARKIELDAMFLLDGTSAAWRSMREHDDLPLDIYLTLASDYPAESNVSVADLGRWLAFDRMISNTGKAQRLAEIETEAQRLLDEHHTTHGQSVILDYWERLTTAPEDDDLAWLFNELGSFADPATTRSIVKARGFFLRDYADPAWAGDERWDTHLRLQVRWPRLLANPSTVRLILQDWQKALFRKAENNVRARHSMPAVGDGWASEAALARQLEVAFPSERVVRQGSPKWLGRQRFDIWFPERNVAVEYQGEQHFRPVALFGGEAGHEETLRRDDQKRRLARENGCILIEVFPNYEFEYVRETVATALASRQAI